MIRCGRDDNVLITTSSSTSIGPNDGRSHQPAILHPLSISSNCQALSHFFADTEDFVLVNTVCLFVRMSTPKCSTYEFSLYDTPALSACLRKRPVAATTPVRQRKLFRVSVYGILTLRRKWNPFSSKTLHMASELELQRFTRCNSLLASV